MLKKVISVTVVLITLFSCTSENTNSSNTKSNSYRDTINNVEAVARFLENREFYLKGFGNDSVTASETRSGKNDYWYRAIIGKGNIDGQFSQYAKDMSDGYEIFKIKNDTILILE